MMDEADRIKMVAHRIEAAARGLWNSQFVTCPISLSWDDICKTDENAAAMFRYRAAETLRAAGVATLEIGLMEIADIAEGSTTANSLPHIAKIARVALAEDNDG
jgi:hypothetical protein